MAEGKMAGTASAEVAERRRPNRWGEGSLLRAEIVSAARRVLEREGTDTAVSLRGVAREAGIAAASIYRHFNDRDQLLEAVIASVWDDLSSFRQQAFSALGDHPSARDRLRAGCLATIEFAFRHRSSMHVIWTRPRPSALPQARRIGFTDHVELLATIAEAAPQLSSAQIRHRGQLVWAAVHGLGTLPVTNPRFPWADSEVLVDELLDLVVGSP